MVELDVGHGEGDGHKSDDQVLNLEKRKRKTKPYGDQGKGIIRGFVSVIKTLESVITFRVDGRTIKRGS